jgi:hypothetical protein
MYYASLDVDVAILRTAREVAKAAPEQMSAYFDGVVRPRVESLAQEKLAPYPGPTQLPFAFGTARSRRFYFAAKVPRGSRGGRYQRTGELAQAWRVDIDRRRNEGAISIRNVSPVAIYVFGVWQTLGHERTGWGKDFPAAIREITDITTDLLIDGWAEVLGIK